MADNDIEIKVKVDAQGAITVLDKLGNEIEKVDSTSQQTGRGFELMGSRLIALNQGLELAQKAFSLLQGGASAVLDTISQGSAIGDMEESFAKLSQKAGATSDVLLNQLNTATADTISNFDLMKKSNELLQAGLKPDAIVQLSKAARVFAEEDGSNMKDTIDELSRSLIRGDDRFLKSKGIIIDNNKAFADFAATIGTTGDKLNEVGKQAAIREAGLAALGATAARAADIEVDAGDRIDQINKTVKDSFDSIKKSIAANDGVLKFLGDFANGLKIVIPAAVDIAVRAISKLSKALDVTDDTFQIGWEVTKKWAENLIKYGPSVDGFAIAVAQVKGATLEHAKAAQEAATALDAQTSSISKMNSGFEALEDFLSKTNEKQETSTEVLSKSTNAVDKYTKAIEQTTDETAKAAKETEAFAKKLEENLANAISGLGQALITGTDLQSASLNVGTTAGSLIGQGISKSLGDSLGEIFGAGGTALGGPAGTLIGSILGSRIGDDVNKAMNGDVIPAIKDALALPTAGLSLLIPNALFGGGSEGTQMKKAADKFFADAFDANRLQLIINDQLSQITDLQFSGNQDGGLFAGLSQSAQQAFEGVGAAFEGLLGISSELGVNIGNVLANNVGGSLNNLQLLVEATGKSFEELSDATVTAFLDGAVSADAALQSLNAIKQISEKGIPDGLGFTVQAFDNLARSTTTGGRVSIDALQDIGFEAKELGLDFKGAQDNILASGKFSAEAVAEVFNSLSAHGIDTIDELTSATAKDLIPVLSDLEKSGFLKEASEQAAELARTISELPDRKDIEVNLRVNTSGDTQALNNYVNAGKPGGGGNGIAI